METRLRSSDGLFAMLLIRHFTTIRRWASATGWVITLVTRDVLVTFPGELVVQIGLNTKERSPYDTTFVAGYTNGRIYYAPTAEQLRNVGGAQEDILLRGRRIVIRWRVPF